MKIILGSGSPRRKEILSRYIREFDIRIPHIDEEEKPGENPVDYSRRISEEKNQKIRKNIDTSYPTLVITSDTIVTIDNIILGKTDSFEDAMQTLLLLSGRKHKVISSITLNYIENEEKQTMITHYDATTVLFKNLTQEKINHYLSNIHFQDKAGSYAIQDKGELIVESITGSMTNIIGFPLGLFFSMLSEFNLIHEFFNYSR